jgi:hypothetical protein
MSKTLRTVATIAAAAALIATGVGAVAGTAVVVAGVKIGTIAAIASTTAGVASAASQILAPKPIARGSPAQVVIDIEPPRPYIVGQVMTGGVMRHDVAYGATLKKVPNPFRWQVRVLSGVGPIQGIVGEYFDFALIDNGYFGGFFNSVQNLGTRPQTTALVPPYGAAPGWTTSSRLSGCAHVGLNFNFDRDGKVFASGLPIYTALCDGERVYDPRQDSTYPGGSGACRAGVESTYVYNRNPACHAVTYALGRFQNGLRVFGLGQPVDTLDMAAIVDWANDCDANEWTVNMILTEGGTGANLREQRVRNLDDLCAAGGARWYQAGGLLSFDWHRPRLALATLTDDDILEAGGGTDAVQTVRDRMNGVRPQYISPDHNWQQITAAEIVGSTYRTEDGGAKLTQVYPLNGVTNAAQAGELAAYAMTDSREIGPMDLQAKASWRFYRPGDCIEIDSSLVAYDGLAVINQRSLNPQSLAVSLSLKSETPGKHDFALGKVASPPPTPTLLQTTEERDLLAAAAITPRAVDVEFDDNTDLESLKPGEAGSTRNVPRGTYAAGTTYVRGDSVIFSGSSYQLIVASSTGNAPPDVARWALLANAGSGPAGADGLPGLTVIVSNEAHVVATAADGSGGDYTGAGGQMRVLRGETVLTPTFSIAAKTPNTSWISIDSSGNYTVTDPGVDLATATLRAVNVGVNYDRTYTLAKSKAGAPGTPGTNGLTNASVFIYRRSATTPALPTTTSSYTFVTGAITGLDNGWTRSVPSGTLPLYVAVAVASSSGTTDTIAAGEWSSPVVLAQDGAAGLNSASVFLYRRSASAPPVPSVTSTYTFATGVLTGQNNSWQQSVPSGADPVWIITASAAATSATDTIAAGEWSSPAILAENGAQGPVGPRLQLTVDAQAFTFTDGAANPGSQTITLTALLNNLSGTATWSTSPSVTLGGSGNTRTLTVADFGANRQVTVEATLGGITDKITLVRVDRDASGSNAVVNSDFTRGKFGWRWRGGAFEADWGVNLPGWFGQRNVMWANVPGTLAAGAVADLAPNALWGGASIANAPLFAMPVVQGDRLAATVLAAPHRCTFQLFMLFFDGAGAWIAYAPSASGGTLGGATNGDPANFGLLTVVDTAPANARWAIPMMRMVGTGEGLPFIFFTEPMLTKIAAGQTTAPRYSSGRADSLGQPNSDITIDGGGIINGIGTAGIPVNNALVPLGNANRVPFSRFEGGRGWGGSGAPIGGNPFPLTFDGRQFIVSQPTFTASGQFHFLFNNPPFPVVPGERLSISSLIQAFPISGPNPINWLLFVDYRDAANNQVGSTSIATALLGVSEASGRFSGFSTVPASARSAVIAINAQSAGAGQLQVGFLEPMVASATADQTVHPPYAPGPNASDGADPNGIITIDGNGVINGIGTASISVDNRRNALQGLLSARPASGQFIGQEYHATDTREIYQWDGSNWRTSADITATAQRSIEPQFPSIEIKQGEAGHTGNRTVTHTAKRGTATLTGGTWSLPSSNLGAGSASISSSTGTVTLSGIVQSGAYAVRYTHTDSLATDLAVNVTYVPTPPSGGTGGAKAGATTSNTGVGNDNNWNQVISLTITGTPNPGRVFLNDFECSLSVQNGTGTCSHEARLLVNGTVVRNEGPQSTVTGGASDFIDFSSLFIGGVYAVGAANTTVSVEMRRTLGTGTISQMSNSLGCTVIAT